MSEIFTPKAKSAMVLAAREAHPVQTPSRGNRALIIRINP